MTNGREITRIWGVPIRVHWSALLIAVLIVPALAGRLLPDAAPGAAGGAYWTAAIVGGVLFAASILLHELGHTLVALRNGIPVRSVTLWALGGVAALEKESDRPGTEARVALAGPATSVALAVGSFGLAWALDVMRVPAVTVAMLAWLGVVNAILAVFNMIPAAPLDGGRVLKAALWSRHGDRHRATISASRAGRATGWVLIGVGLLSLVQGGAGLWPAVIGWFVLSAARQEEGIARIHQSLDGRRVADVLSAEDQVVDGWTIVDEFVERDLPHLNRPFVVVRDAAGRRSGVVSVLDLRRLDPHDRSVTSLGWVATPVSELRSVGLDTPATDALPALDPRFGAAPVVDDGELVGWVTVHDLLRPRPPVPHP